MPEKRSLLAFAHIEKCGGTTLIETLRRNYPFSHVDMIPIDPEAELVGQDDLARARAIQPWLRSFAGHSVRPYSDFGRFEPRIKMYTLLRDPTKRYVSDYLHDVSRRGYRGSIHDYLSFTEKHNFIVKSLAGENDLTAAKNALTERISFYGFVERYDDFMHGLQELFKPAKFDPSYVHVNYAMLEKTQKTGQASQRPKFSEAELDAVREVNQVDQALYNWAFARLGQSETQKIEMQKEQLSFTEKAAVFANRAMRNFCYKPLLGHRPGSYHALPRNREDIETTHGSRS